MRIQPAGPTVDQLPRLQSPTTVLRILYLIFTIVCSWWYLDLIYPHLENDYWWPRFNTTGTQTFISDVFNAKLTVNHEPRPFPMIGVTREKDYSTTTTFIDVRRTAARQLLLQPIPPERAITVLQANAFQSNLLLTSPYCWVDLERRWELAHTAKRQARCHIHDVQNAAVYLEILLRNSVDWRSSQYTFRLESAILNDVKSTPEGENWVRLLTALSFHDELLSWQNHNLTSWTGQVQNLVQEGYDDSIMLVNALGIEQSIKIASISDVNRGLSAWTTGWASSGLLSDLIVCQVVHCSLVRGSPLHPEELGIDWDTDMYNGNTETVGRRLIRRSLGPYMSIDLRFVQPPSSLIRLFTDFDESFSSLPQLKELDEICTVDAAPIAWQSNEFVFYGGNPLCPFGPAKEYIQQSFGYYDDCGSQDQHTIDFASRSVAFAVSTSSLEPNEIPLICRACTSTYSSCSNFLMKIATGMKVSLQRDQVHEATQDVEALNLTMIQMATNTSDNADMILTQEIIAAGDPWSIFGWVAIWEWVDGQREVFVFDGDEGSFTIISRSYGYLQLPANKLEIPRVACNYIRFLATYVNAILSALSLALLAFGAFSRFCIDGSNLLFFNRVVGSVWIGRPLLFLRGMTAVLVLSTSSADFQQLKGAAFMSSNDRPFVEIALLAGESTWVVYGLSDLLLPVTTHLSSLYAPLSSVLAFILTSAIETYKPYQMTASITRSCSFKTLMSGVVCTSGKVFIGSLTRACILVAVQLGCVVASYEITVAVNKSLTRPRVAAEMTQHVAIPAASDAFFATVKNSSYNLDSVSCVMSGIIPAFGCVFDVKLWTLFEVEQSKRVSSGVVLRRCTLGTKRTVERIFSTPTPKRIQRVWGILGLIYMGLSISGSYAFLRLTESTMINDFWWTSFELNNTQSYLCNWFNSQLTPILYEDSRVHLNDFERALLVTKENTTDPNINIAPAYALMIQDEINSLPNIILALRSMNGCDLPWIFTGYCFLDFDQTWELANSNGRQERCRQKYTSNGAVYLESLFRNNREFSLCWNEVLDTSIFAALHQSNDGLKWKDGVFTAQLTIQDEAAFWHDHGIHYYTPQWQNFKSLGVIETMDIFTALGTSYPLTLKKSNGTLQLSKQTSYKMYWGLAGDLAAIALNGSTIHGQSLIRQASNFAFQNISIEVPLMNNLTLQVPLSSGMNLVRAKLGPFGSIDMYNVAMPLPLLQLYNNLTKVLVALLASSAEAQPEFWSLYASTSISAQPSIWDGALFWGGNVMCPEQLSPLPQALIFFSSQGLCTISILELMELTPETSFQALIATGILYNMTRITSIQAVCQRVAQVDTCTKWLRELKSFSERHITSRVEMELAFAAAQTIKQSDIHLQLFQYISREDKVILMSTPGLFDDVDFEFFSWIMLFEWARGLREAVTFQGDVGSLTLMSTKYYFTKTPADSMEVPLNLARYVHRVVQYFTLILLCVALTVVLYIFHSRGFIQGINLFSFNRVAGLVWLGRPLVFVRGVTAITLLSTASLDLRRPHSGLVAFLDTPPVDPIKAFFSASEATWLTYLLNDVFSIVTRQHTASYSLKSSLLLWVAAATWSFLSPVTHTVDIHRVCTVVSVNNQAVCHSGQVKIGNNERFVGLILLAIATCVLSYAFERTRHRLTKSKDEPTSLFLYAAAKYQFRRDEWEYMGVYYLDRASAVLNGILSLTIREFHYVFDIKTWRLYIYAVDEPNSEEPAHLRYALPLPE